MRSKKMLIMVLVILVALLLVMLPTSVAWAASLSKMSDELSTIKASTAANHTIKFRISTGVALDSTITITFPAGFAMGTIESGDIDLSHGATTGAETEETLAAAASTTEWGAAVSGQVLTLTAPGSSGAIAANDYVIVEIGTNASGGSNQITNPTAGTHQVDIGGSFGDTGSLAVVIVDDNQVAVTGTVLPTLSFSLSANTAAFGNLSSASVATAGTDITLTMSTNGTNGYTVTVKDEGDASDPGLWSAAADNLIASATAALSAGTEGYGIQASGSGATIDSVYDKTGNDVGALSRIAQTLATNTGPADGDTVTVTHKAAISNITEPEDYVDTITYNVIANF
ncbi:hypothetical protein ACFLQQ_01855 [Actinomycetota bacterium]